jgi:hypothetical protein
MKPGDLVHIFNFDDNGNFVHVAPKIGLIVGYDDSPNLANPILVLVDGVISGYNSHELLSLRDQ